MSNRSNNAEQRTLWLAPLLISTTTLLSFLLYWFTLAPGLTWANHGADGGELIAAAMVNGVPHPPGYPLYMLLLQAWLGLGRAISPTAEPAWLGNLFSALLTALSVGITVPILRHQLQKLTQFSSTSAWLLAAVGALAWASSPLMWGQALITEVYALHALLFVFLAWSVLIKYDQLSFVLIAVALGIANHLTTILLLPAVLYLLWQQRQRKEAAGKAAAANMVELVRIAAVLALGGLLGTFFYIRIPLVAAEGPPINWGYADNWEGFWWLVSANAYRNYLFGAPLDLVFDRITRWAYTITSQYTVVGLALVTIGLAHLDKVAPRLRNFCLLWLIPVNVYAIIYYTRDSEINLLPALWLMTLLLTIGFASLVDWIADRDPASSTVWRRIAIGVAAISLFILVLWRAPSTSLRMDSQAQAFLDDAVAKIEPGGIVVSSNDAETFALWYGAWGNGVLHQAEPKPIFVNYALQQFGWYRRLLADLYPEVPGISESLVEILAKNDRLTENEGKRPVYFAEDLSNVVGQPLEPFGKLWRFKAEE